MWETVLELAWAQHGAVATRQVVDRGGSESWLRRRVADGSLCRAARGVYVVTGSRATPERQLMVRVLAAGPAAWATGDSALAVWSPELGHPSRPVVAVPRGCGHRTTAAVVHRSRDLDLAKPGVRAGIPVVGVARALLDASPGRTADAVLRRIDACRRHLPLAPGALVEALHDHARRGRPGIATFRQAVVSLGREVPDSEFERLVLRDLARAGVPTPELHHVVRVDGDPFELDLAWPDDRLDVELDGRDHVERSRTARRDRARDRRLQSIGIRVLRYTWRDYAEDVDGMLAEIARFLT